MLFLESVRNYIDVVLLFIQLEYTEKLEVGYRHFDANDIEPLFAFGFGLSYTKFDYSKVTLTTKGNGDEVSVSASVEITNSGGVDGAEVAQAYISFPDSAGEPPKQLRGFEKVHLKASKKEKVTFEFGKTELSIWDTDSKSWVIPSGEFAVHVGASSRDVRDSVSFTLE